MIISDCNVERNVKIGQRKLKILEKQKPHSFRFTGYIGLQHCSTEQCSISRASFHVCSDGRYSLYRTVVKLVLKMFSLVWRPRWHGYIFSAGLTSMQMIQLDHVCTVVSLCVCEQDIKNLRKIRFRQIDSTLSTPTQGTGPRAGDKHVCPPAYIVAVLLESLKTTKYSTITRLGQGTFSMGWTSRLCGLWRDCSAVIEGMQSIECHSSFYTVTMQIVFARGLLTAANEDVLYYNS